MTFIIESYKSLIQEMIGNYERDILELTGKEYKIAYDGLITLKAHLIQVEQILEAVR